MYEVPLKAIRVRASGHLGLSGEMITGIMTRMRVLGAEGQGMKGLVQGRLSVMQIITYI